MAECVGRLSAIGLAGLVRPMRKGADLSNLQSEWAIHEQKSSAGVVDISQRSDGGVAGLCAKPSHGAGVSWSGDMAASAGMAGTATMVAVTAAIRLPPPPPPAASVPRA